MRREHQAETGGWEAAYQRRPTPGREVPHEDAEWLQGVFQEHHVRCILDLGCGDGRHLVWLAARDYEMHGQDSAPTALCLAEGWLEKEGLSAKLICSDMTEIPWADGTFDAVLCVRVINHNRIAGIRKTIAEIHRVLRQGGLLFVVVGTCGPIGRFRNGVEVEPNTYVLLKGPEAGVPHHFFDKEELRTEFSTFDLLDLHKDSREATCLLLQKPGSPAGGSRVGGV